MPLLECPSQRCTTNATKGQLHMQVRALQYQSLFPHVEIFGHDKRNSSFFLSPPQKTLSCVWVLAFRWNFVHACVHTRGSKLVKLIPI